MRFWNSRRRTGPASCTGVTCFGRMTVRQLANRAGLTVAAISAPNCLSTRWDDSLAEVKNDPAKWEELLRMELSACCEEGCVGMGDHIIIVGKKE